MMASCDLYGFTKKKEHTDTSCIRPTCFSKEEENGTVWSLCVRKKKIKITFLARGRSVYISFHAESYAFVLANFVKRTYLYAYCNKRFLDTFLFPLTATSIN